MSRIAIIAALPGELKPLVYGWERRGRKEWVGRLGDHDVIAVAGGIGASAARRAAERVFVDLKPDMLISYGWCGALTCAVKPPGVCAISDVIDAGTGERFVTDYSDGYRLITLDRVAHVDEKRGLAQKHQGVLVDMEAAAVARVAQERQVGFYSFKGVSDGYQDRLPDFSRFINGQGELRMTALLAHVAVRPRYWPAMLRLGKNSSVAATALSSFIQRALKGAL